MSLKTRRNKINATVQNTREIYRRDDNYRAYAVTSPTSNKPYQVTLDLLNSSLSKILTVKCHLYTFEHKKQPHRANYSKYICCQFLAAVKWWAAKKAGKIVSFCESLKDAKRLLNFGGQLVKIVNLNGSVVYGTVR